jgi:AraC family transcriptional regulator
METKLTSGSFYGRTLAIREGGGFLFAHSRYASKERIPPHTHENPFFYFVLQGVCREVYGNKQVRTGVPSTLVFHPAEEQHSNDWQEQGGGQCFHIEISPERLTRLREHQPLVALERPHEFHAGLPVSLAHRLYQEFQTGDDLSALVMEGLALELLAETSRLYLVTDHRRHVSSGERKTLLLSSGPPPAPPRWLRAAEDVLRARFAQPLSLEEIAHAAGVHSAHLSRVFRAHHQCTIGEYIRQLRVEFACRELSATDTPLAEIALAAGFTDQSHFTRTFKRLMRLTPAEYRRRSCLRSDFPVSS